MKNSEILQQMVDHTQNLRNSIPGNPSPETLAAWRFEDMKREALIRYYQQQEIEEPTITLKSEVRVK